MDMLTREDGLKPPTLLVEGPVELPRLKRAVYVRELTFEELLEIDHLSWETGEDDKVEFNRQAHNAGWIVMSACDAQGKAIFTLDDVPAILKWHGRDGQAVVRAAQALNPASEAEVEAKVKN